MKACYHSARRRGVIILIVLCLLVLFGLIAVSFAIVAGQYLRASRAAGRAEQMGDPSTVLLDAALYQVLSGSEMYGANGSEVYSTQSVLRGHSLLRDLYGFSDSVSAKSASGTVVGSQLIDISCTAPSSKFQAIPGYYNGCVFTMKDGLAAGYSTRVVNYTPTVSGGAVTSCVFRVEPFESDRRNLTSELLDSQAQADAFSGKTFVVNGRPNNGNGFGYKGGSISTEALLPNYSNRPLPLDTSTSPPKDSDTDEGFDVPDYRDMWLSYFPAGFQSSGEITPSFHRPDLIWYWKKQGPSNLSRCCLRPLPTDNPNFSGSNPYLDPANFAVSVDEVARRLSGALSSGAPDPQCQWDVDNDRDGIYDSVWLDIGLPVKTSRDGRVYKPLVAVLIRDLDGRLNINANGNTRQTNIDYTSNLNAVTAGGNVSVAALRGNGWGPAEINLAGFLSSIGFSSSEVDNFMTGRYGGDGQPGTSGAERYSLFKTQGMPTDYVTALGGWGSPPDVWGRGAAMLDPDGNGQFYAAGRTLNPSSPQVDERINSPYEMNLVGPTTSDTPYTLQEYERLLRKCDVDSHNLYSRLPSYGSIYNTTANIEAITPASFDVPSPMAQFPSNMRTALPASSSGTIADLFIAKLKANGLNDTQAAAQVAIMLPLELQRGQRFNVNRLWGNGRDEQTAGQVGYGTTDEPAEITNGEQVFGAFDGSVPQTADYANTGPMVTAQASGDVGRQMYARYLYCLAMALVDDNYFFPVNDSEVGNDATKLRELKAYRLAQWAVNCVDFRDPDAIMTPFEYDTNPWNGWDVDGNLATDAGATANEAGVTTQRPTERRVVWGMEYPELRLTETFAMHDRRVDDKSTDSFGSNHAREKADHTIVDTTLDQVGMPQGSLFIELYCARNPAVYDSSNSGRTRSLPPPELYTYQTSGSQTVASLDLARLSPATSATPPSGVTPSFTYPVWRIGLSDMHWKTPDKSAAALAKNHPETTNFQPGDVNTPGEMNILAAPGTGGTSRTVGVRTLIWFANLAPSNATPSTTSGRVYYNRYATPVSSSNPNPTYLLPGGSYAIVGPRAITRIGGRDDPPNSNPPSSQRLELAQNGLTVFNFAGGDANAAAIKKPALGIIAAANLPNSPSLGPASFGPMVPSTGIGVSVSEPRTKNDAAAGRYYPIPDVNSLPGWPADDGEGYSYSSPPDIPFDDPASPNFPTLLQSDPDLRTTGTKEDLFTAYLQRLANPLAPFDPVTNPYLTVDWMPIDLTVFNGIAKKPSTWDTFHPGVAWDKDDQNPSTPLFSTRQRDGNGVNNLWSANMNALAVSSTGGDGKDYFRYNLTQTLGYLNSGFGNGVNGGGNYVGSPATPFPWLTWLNRPYNTPLELMLVPTSSLARLGVEHSTGSADNPYVIRDVNGETLKYVQAPYKHLLNFFQSTRPSSSAVPDYGSGVYNSASSELCRIFDYLEVPSPFIGTERWYDSSALGAYGTYLQPPFNNFPRFRDPGRVNLNTVADKRVLQAIVGLPNGADMDNLWNDFKASRRGYSGTKLDENYPSCFAHPFCSASGADLAPVDIMRYKGVDATLLRPNPSNLAQPLFLGATYTNSYDDTTRNPMFAYTRLTRLANLTTTRSNVFAVWITVGYFEYDPVNNTLGRELGWDTGEVTRNRAFFMIDRSLPVCFVPGEVNNVDRCVLVRRYIE